MSESQIGNLHSTASQPPVLPEKQKINWKDKRIAPHWSLLIAALIILVFLLDSLRSYLNPLIMSVGILLLLYPSRRIRAIKPFLFLAFVTVLISIWWRLSSLLMPFIIAFILAYAFDPLIGWAVRRGIPRLVAIFILVLGLLGMLVGAAIIIIPQLIDEIGTLVNVVPEWIGEARTWGTEVALPWLVKVGLPTDKIWAELQPRMPALMHNLISGIANWSALLMNNTMNLASWLASLILIPIVTIYFLYDFDRLRKWVYSLFPDDYKPDALKAYHRLNESLAAFVRGQLLVCLFLAIWISSGLLIFAHLPYAILLGTAAGFLNIIPYVGTTSAAVVTVVIALFQPSPFPTALKVAAVFLVGQQLEANFITPRIVGDRVGLHPIVVIFVVLLFASFFGIMGMLIAVPVSAASKVLLQIWSERQRRIEGIVTNEPAGA